MKQETNSNTLVDNKNCSIVSGDETHYSTLLDDRKNKSLGNVSHKTHPWIQEIDIPDHLYVHMKVRW